MKQLSVTAEVAEIPKDQQADPATGANRFRLTITTPSGERTCTDHQQLYHALMSAPAAVDRAFMAEVERAVATAHP